MKADVLVPSYNRPEKLSKCLDSLSKQTIKDFKVYCILRPSDGDSNEVARKFVSLLNIEILPITTDGVIAAENLGISKTSARYTLFIDDDAYAPEDWVESILEHFEKPPFPVAVGGRDFVIGSPEQSNLTANRVGYLNYFGKLYGNHHKQSVGIKRVSTLKGVNMAVRNSFLHFLDETLHSNINLGNGSQWELDLFMKLSKYGEIIFDPSICVQHDSNHSHFISEKVRVNDAHNLTYVLLKHFTPIRRVALCCYITLFGNAQIHGLLKSCSLIFKEKGLLKKLILSQSGFLGGIESFLTRRSSSDHIKNRPIIYLCPNGYIGGAETFVLNACKNHKKELNPIILFFKSGPAVELANKMGLNTIVLKNSPKLSSPFKLIKSLLEFRKILNCLNPKLIHSTMAYSQLFKGLSLRNDIPSVWFQHGPVGGHLDYLASLFGCNKILFNSKQLQTIHNMKTPVFQTKKGSEIINLGIKDLKDKNYKDTDRKNVCFGSVGRISRIKGQKEMISEYIKLAKKNKKILQNSKFLLIGSSNNRDDDTYLESIVELKKRNPEVQIELLPQQSNLDDCIQKIDIFIHFPKFLEPFGLAVAEAMKVGIFTIGPKEGGINAFLKDKITGLTVDSLGQDAADELQASMNTAFDWLIADNPNFDKIRLQGKRYIEQNFNNKNMSLSLERIYEELYE